MEILYTDTRHIKKILISIAQMQTPQVLLLSKFLNLSHLHLKRGVFMHSCMYSSVRSGWTMGG